ncbi:MAG: hypothetical protein A2Y77_10205 [Planctomycetes bacterium RBG_13_62_9]|nr:MAG: hypothetical protein A2Y77_10205 [Planctomycetes bacterium RBG_13_62_9]
MTSDAKIGLLLGLVFIFVIAFIINGLPNLRAQPTKAEVTTMIPDDDFGVVGSAPKAFNSSPLPDPQPVTAVPQSVVEEPKPAEQEVQQPQTASSEGVRSTWSLPRFEDLLDRIPNVVKRVPTGPSNLEPSGPVTDPLVSAGRQPTGPDTQPTLFPRPSETVTKAPEVGELPKPAATTPSTPAHQVSLPRPNAPASLPAGKIYVAVDGDNLALIAKKVYGLEEGNKRANGLLIYEANKAQMKSPNDVKAGQKLIIPPLPRATPVAHAPTPAEVLDKAIVEKVEAIGRGAVARIPAPTPSDRWYTVQDGDNLWRIAAGHLGSGVRWDEIQRLNTDILKAGEPVPVGVRLRLPPK